MTRHIDLDGIDNFRDFGGYATANGRGMKRGVLFRSANHATATDQDLAVLRDLGVSTVVDLRRPHERVREPSRRWDGFSGRVVESDGDDGHVDWAEHLRSGVMDASRFHNDGLTFYSDAPFNPHYVSLFRQYFQTLAGIDGAMVVHCTAGKDRTGLICAFTHHLAGVHRDDMLDDFLLTNEEQRLLRRMEVFRPRLSKISGKPVDDDTIRAALSVHPDFLETAFAKITASHGSLDRYLEEVLGVDAALRARIEAKILA